MGTFLFDNIIFGPVRSRRLGRSLGINLLPLESKLCNFNCIYCECGWTDNKQKFSFHPTEEVGSHLETTLKKMIAENDPLDVITFAGNGEPTMHPEFEKIIDRTIELRDQYMPDCEIAVLSNATMLHKGQVKSALKKIDQCILKLDAGSEEMFSKVDEPLGGISLSKIVKALMKFDGETIIQSMFFKGLHKGEVVDNTEPKELAKWLDHIVNIAPVKVMIYSIDRDTPAKGLIKVLKDELEIIAESVRAKDIQCEVA
ncbi:MAG: radical SAM protein [Flavobacteriales bacterium]|nr:radical SAM protein [Flavobacteriales bacterium]